MSITAINQSPQIRKAQAQAHLNAKYSTSVSSFAKKTGLIVLGCFVLIAATNIPCVSADAAGYLSCIHKCVRDGGANWITALACPAVCAPFLALPG